jgi:hypothetical protein
MLVHIGIKDGIVNSLKGGDEVDRDGYHLLLPWPLVVVGLCWLLAAMLEGLCLPGASSPTWAALVTHVNFTVTEEGDLGLDH